MPIISLREFERLHIGEFDVELPSVRPEQARQIEGLRRRHGFDVFDRTGEATLSASQYVGENTGLGRVRVTTVDLTDLRTVPSQIRALVGAEA